MLGITALQQKFNLQHAIQMPVRKAFWSFFLLDTPETAFTMTNSFDRSTKSEHFFQFCF